MVSVGPCWVMLGHLGSMLVPLGPHRAMMDQHGVIIAHLGSSLGLWGEKVAVATARLTFSKATMPLGCGQFEIWGRGRGWVNPSL